ncbi:MAG TPA: hypothetical protein DHV28_16580 [Ignavibacteriales bacterium]|nr:hypothetical protein [Ignavibacteriales bacterium]
MKKIKLVLSVIVLCFLFQDTNYAQLINIQRFIGRSQIDLINELGTPVHFDDSNPLMMHMTYNFLSIECIADQNGIYQVQLTRKYTSEKEAYDDIKDFIACSIREGFISDSISAKKFILKNKGIKTEISLDQLIDSPYIELKIEALRKTDE